MIAQMPVPSSVRRILAAGGALHTREVERPAPASLADLAAAFDEHQAATEERLGAQERELVQLRSHAGRVIPAASRGGGPTATPGAPGADRDARVADLPDAPLTRSAGGIVTNSTELRSFRENGYSGRVNIKVRSITTATDSAGALVAPDRQPEPVMMPQRPMRMRDLLNAGRTTSNSVQLMRQTTRNNAAATVAEGALKPESTYAFQLVDFKVRTLAHWTQTSKQVLDDAPLLGGIIDGELRYGLADAEDHQLLNGDGQGENLLGLMPQATPFANPGAAAPVGMDPMVAKLRQAILQVRLAKYPATGIVIHPIDWAQLQLAVDKNGRPLFKNYIQNNEQPRLWNLPIVETEEIAEGQFLVGAFGLAAQIFDRWDANVWISSEDRDNFVRNLVTILAEERLALAVTRPAALVKGPFDAPAGA